MYNKFVSVNLRSGLGLVFLLAAVNKLVLKTPSPLWMEQYFNVLPFIRPLFPMLVGVLELVLALMLLIGIYTRYVALLSVGFFVIVIASVSIIVTGGFGIVFKDIGLLGLALGLAFKDQHEYSLDEYVFR